ncbi:MAG: tetratricopeptide repeat protein [Gammaproteobacteria bacterium]|nr:tetratricopeptide repeat protein [Gammaproteobacteria bacterium]MBU1416527.1 tetratricopeptide repeat protein [Gammaproteobacteria bacterium]
MSLPPEQQLREAAEHFRAGRLAEAGAIYMAIVEASPDHPQANYSLGRIAVAAGQPEAGLAHFVAALNADPESGPCWLHYVDALLLAGHDEEARSVLALARQHGLAGPEVDELVARAQEDDEVAEPAAPVAASRRRNPRRGETDTLLALFRQGRYADVVAQARAMTRKHPRFELGWKTLGVALQLLGRNDEAVEPLQKTVELLPADAEAQYNLGVALQESDRLEEAESCYRRALRLDAGYDDAALNLGVALHKLGRMAEAEQSLRDALRRRPRDAAAHDNLGSTLLELGRPDEAETSFRRAIEIAPGNANTHRNLGMALYARDRLDEAEVAYRDTLRLAPDDAEAHNRLAVLLQGSGRMDEADEHFRQALAIAPEAPMLHGNRGNLLKHMGRLGEAEACFREALRLAPQDAAMHGKLGYVLWKTGRLIEAEAVQRRACELDPDDDEALNALGNTLRDLGQLDEAETCFRRILQIRPDSPSALSNLGLVLATAGRREEAADCFRTALRLAPDHPALYGNYLHFLTLSESAEGDAGTLFAEHVRFGERFEAPLRDQWPVHAQSCDPERRLKIGFVSPDLYEHPVATFVEPIVGNLVGHPMLELHAYYNNFINDEVTGSLRRYFDHWHAIANLPDAELAASIGADEIDILIDLAGHTAHGRLLTFARKPAPVQASWIGYPGTTGLRAMDYFFADRYLLPPGRFDHQFTEKIVRLPANTPFLPQLDAPEVNALPALANGYLTFGSFNRPNKLNREAIAIWATLLRALPTSRMLLGGMPEHGQYDRLLASFAEEGIARERLTFHPREGMAGYMRLHHQVDLCLDTFPYNGGTTTLHALWMGVPTLTVAGNSMRGRTGSAILSRVGMQDFVVEQPEALVDRGLYWAAHLDELSRLRSGMRQHLGQAPLRNPKRLAASFHLALRTMWRRWCEGLPPESFEVPLAEIEDSAGS